MNSTRAGKKTMHVETASSSTCAALSQAVRNFAKLRVRFTPLGGLVHAEEAAVMTKAPLDG